MNVNDFGHVSIVFEYDMMCARVYRVKCFNFSNIRTDFYIKIRIRRMRILINSVTSLIKTVICVFTCVDAMMLTAYEAGKHHTIVTQKHLREKKMKSIAK